MSEVILDGQSVPVHLGPIILTAHRSVTSETGRGD